MRLTVSIASLLLLCRPPPSDGSGNASEMLFQQNVDDVIFRRDIKIDDKILGQIEVHRGEEPADAVFAFARQHGLGERHRSAVVDNICGAVPCTRKRALVWKADVEDKDRGFHGMFELYDGMEPVDQVHEFAWRNGLAVQHRNAILVKACEVVGCQRVEPVIWRKLVAFDGQQVEVVIKEGEEPADVIFATLHGLPYMERRKVLDAAKSDGVPYTMEFALAFSKAIQMEDGSFESTLQVYEDGTEPVDAVYKFALEHKLEDRFDQISASVLPQLCELLPCQRTIPAIWSRDLTTENGTPLGRLGVLKGEEPIDAIDRFIQFAGLSAIYGDDVSSYRNNVLQVVCQEIACTRTVPIVFQKDVTEESGNFLGSVKILEGEEVVDAVERFIKETRVDIDQVALKKYLFQNACDIPQVSCTSF